MPKLTRLLAPLFIALAAVTLAVGTPSLVRSAYESVGASGAGDSSGVGRSAGSGIWSGGTIPGESLEGPIDPAVYRLGPGDRLNIRIGLKPPIDRVLKVSPEGVLILPEGALIPVAGMTIVEAERLLTKAMAVYYRNPEVHLNILDIRTFGVFVVGEVKRPGAIVATSVDRASAVIERAGGLTAGASSRAVRLTRTSGEVVHVDLGRFESTGSMESNPIVDAGDRIYVPPTGESAVVSGAVMRPGPVEVIEGDSVGAMIALAHGLREDALLDSAYIESFSGTASLTNRRYVDLHDRASWRVPIQKRDLLFVRPKAQWTRTRTVLISGEVRHAGTHALTADSLPLTEMIALAGGFTEDASLATAYVLRPQEKLPPDPEFERLSKLSTTDMTSDEYDYYVMKLQGRSRIVSTDFVQLFQRRNAMFEIQIRPGDLIMVPRSDPYVMVVGEVGRPGSVPYVPDLSVDEYIRKTGGFSFRAAKGRVTVIRAVTGEWVKKGKVNRIGPGDTIWIPQKRHTFWKETLAGIGIVSQLATIYLVIYNTVK
jgi:polysaccharide biosynthesis/export protein